MNDSYLAPEIQNTIDNSINTIKTIKEETIKEAINNDVNDEIEDEEYEIIIEEKVKETSLHSENNKNRYFFK